MNGPVTVRTSRQLRNIESTMFHLLDERVDIHIIPVEHRCPSDEIYELIRKNECNIRKVQGVIIYRNSYGITPWASPEL